MHGIGPPLATPFAEDGTLDEQALRELAGWIVDRDADFLVPCGSNSEAELMTAEERARVVEIVADAVDVPILAGTGSPGFEETRRATAAAADAGADAALVVTPFYYNHDTGTLEAYYRDLADAADVPIYLYSVPVYTDVKLDPAAVGRLASHPNIEGMKDSSGDLAAFLRERRLTEDEEFDLLVGSGSLLAQALDVGGDGGVLALANIAPEGASAVYERHVAGDREAARALNADLVGLNRAVTSRFGIPGMKAGMRARGAPAGYPRRPHRPAPEAAVDEVESLIEAFEAMEL